jgi:hypothetical protein
MFNSLGRVRSGFGASRRATALGASADVKLRETGKRYRRKITNFDDERNGNFSRRFRDVFGTRKKRRKEETSGKKTRRRRTNDDGARETVLTFENETL